MTAKARTYYAFDYEDADEVELESGHAEDLSLENREPVQKLRLPYELSKELYDNLIYTSHTFEFVLKSMHLNPDDYCHDEICGQMVAFGLDVCNECSWFCDTVELEPDVQFPDRGRLCADCRKTTK